MTIVRLAKEADLPAILEISNWAALNTAANFAVEPESLQSWRESWRATHETFPWVVAVGGETTPAGTTLPLAPSLEGRGERPAALIPSPFEGEG